MEPKLGNHDFQLPFSQARCCGARGDPVETSALAGRGEEKIGYLKKADAGASWMILGGIFERLMCVVRSKLSLFS